MTCRIFLLAVWVSVAGVTWAGELDLAAAPQLRVAAIQGSATFTPAGMRARALEVGDVLAPGAMIATSRGAAVDLFLGNSGGTMRLTQLTTLGVDQFEIDGQGVLTSLQVHLYSGSLLGLGNQLPATSRYQIQVSNGFIDVLARQFRIGAQGFLVAMEGTLLFAHIPPGGDPALHELKAPPATYFYPGEGVRPAPIELQREVTAQVQARIR